MNEDYKVGDEIICIHNGEVGKVIGVGPSIFDENKIVVKVEWSSGMKDIVIPDQIKKAN